MQLERQSVREIAKTNRRTKIDSDTDRRRQTDRKQTYKQRHTNKAKQSERTLPAQSSSYFRPPPETTVDDVIQRLMSKACLSVTRSTEQQLSTDAPRGKRPRRPFTPYLGWGEGLAPLLCQGSTPRGGEKSHMQRNGAH